MVSMEVTDADLRLAADVLARLQHTNAELSNLSAGALESLEDAAFAVFGRAFKKRLFGESDVIAFLEKQTEQHKLLRRLERLHNIVQEKHAANIQDARSSGINCMREARTADVNSQGLAALTTQQSLVALVGDLDASQLLLLQASAPSEPSPGTGSTYASSPTNGAGGPVPSFSFSSSSSLSSELDAGGHYGTSGGRPERYEQIDKGGIGRSRGRKAKFQMSRIRGMYDSVEGEEEEEQQDGDGEGGNKACRKRGVIYFTPREGAAMAQRDTLDASDAADFNAAHAGLWLCYVTDDEDGQSRACAHRTVVDMAGSLENLNHPLLLDGASREYPCTYVIGPRKQHWAYLGGAVSGLCGETAISVKLSAAVLLGAAGAAIVGAEKRLLTDGSTRGTLAEEPKFAPQEGEFYRHCNVCKNEYVKLHAFYHQLCPRCGDFNFRKRMQSGDLSGFVCLVTGGRVRIGLQIALKLLRAGATVIVTTRFAHDAALRYEMEADYASFRARLIVDCLELSDLRAVEEYCLHLKARYGRIHVLVNNAAQTITRCAEWLGKMGQLERNSALLLRDAEPLQSSWNVDYHGMLSLADEKKGGGGEGAGDGDGDGTEEGLGAGGIVPKKGSGSSAIVSRQTGAGRWQVLDESGQPLDASGSNSWSRRLEEVSTEETAQTMAVNAISPFILCAKLKELLRPPDMRADPWGHVVNVSSLEGKFNVGKKSGGHPHTNMAKAALNMMTLTSARDYARSGILMNSVDTGWITDMAPGNVGNASRERETFVGPPLDEVDGASRVLDPVFVHVNSGGKEKTHGQFLKDYLRASW